MKEDTEETTREVYERLLKSRPKGMNGAGRRLLRPFHNPQKPRKQYKHDPEHQSAGKPGKTVVCLDTGETYPSVRAACSIVGGSVNMFYFAFREAKGDPRIAKFAGKRWAYEKEMQR